MHFEKLMEDLMLSLGKYMYNTNTCILSQGVRGTLEAPRVHELQAKQLYYQSQNSKTNAVPRLAQELETISLTGVHFVLLYYENNCIIC